MSKLRVNDVLPANGLNIGIGTAGGNLIVGGASTTVVVNGDINITGNVTGSSGATFTNITVGANNGFHVDGGAPANSLTVNNVGDTVVGSGHSVYIADGNLVFQTTGTGIDFSDVGMVSTSATSSILDNYEEGSWVPSFSGRSLGTAEGTYTKIGRQVLIQFNIATLNTSISAGDISINGLPFQARNTNQIGAVFIGDTSGVTYSSGYGRIYGRINAAANSMQLLQRTNDGSTHTTSPGLGTGIVLRGYAWYTTS